MKKLCNIIKQREGGSRRPTARRQKEKERGKILSHPSSAQEGQ